MCTHSVLLSSLRASSGHERFTASPTAITDKYLS